VFPKSIRDIKYVLAFAKEHGMPISVSGNNQGTGGGALSSEVGKSLKENTAGGVVP
jgi:FAD/FMN-containing dehydrogenase